MHGPSPALIGIAVAVVVSLVVLVWFVALRGGGGTSEFIVAQERFVAAARKVEAASSEIQRALQLDAYKKVVDAQLVAMKHQDAVIERIAAEEDGTKRDIAVLSNVQTDRVIQAVDVGAAGIIRRRLSEFAIANSEMQAGLTELERLAAEWKKL